MRGKIVLLRVVGADALHFDDKTCGIDFSAYPYIGSRDIRDFRRRDIKKLAGGKTYAQMYVQDSYKLGGIKNGKPLQLFLSPTSTQKFQYLPDELHGIHNSESRFGVHQPPTQRI